MSTVTAPANPDSDPRVRAVFDDIRAATHLRQGLTHSLADGAAVLCSGIQGMSCAARKRSPSSRMK